MKFKTKPFKHQAKYFDKYKRKIFMANLCEQGTGKSHMELGHAAYLFHEGLINCLLIIAPNEVHANWIEQEIPKHLSVDDDKYVSATFRSSMKKKEERHLMEVIQNDDPSVLKIVAVNIEGVIWPKADTVIKHLIKSFKVLCVIDESTRIANPTAKVTKRMLKFGPQFTARRIATGTPFDRKPLAAWSQFQFLSPSIFDMPYIAFRATYAIMKEKVVKTKSGMDVVQKFPVGYRRLDQMSEIISGVSYRVLKQDCLDLPDKVYQLMELDMSATQKRMYIAMRDELLYMFEGGLVSAGTVLEQLLHLSRITGGFAKQNEPIKDNPKLKWVTDNIDDYTSTGKVIIWARFVDEMKAIQKALGKRAILVYGETPKSKRSVLFDRFRNDDQIDVMVANPKVVGIGLTFLEAVTQVYYSNSYELEVRRQSEDRSHRIGQTNKVLYIDLVMRETIDLKVLENLKLKRDLSDIILKDPSCSWLQTK